MARSKRSIKPRPVFIPAVPEGAVWLESDRYDRRAWATLGLSSAAIRDLAEAGDKLVPRFGALLEDLFVGLFKYNLVWHKPDAVRRSALLNRTILEQLVPSPAFEMINRREMLDLWDLEHQEEDLAQRVAALKNADELSEQAKNDAEAGPATAKE